MPSTNELTPYGSIYTGEEIDNSITRARGFVYQFDASKFSGSSGSYSLPMLYNKGTSGTISHNCGKNPIVECYYLDSENYVKIFNRFDNVDFKITVSSSGDVRLYSTAKFSGKIVIIGAVDTVVK